ncbi:MAG: energy transducer TonB [Rhodocyclaceae bacterium]|nr:energy transducer TonB [Rhodocyclaceae bacterium]
MVALLHGAALVGLWGHRIPVIPDEVATLFVETVTLQPPPAPKEAPRPRRMEKPRLAERPQPQQLTAAAPVLSPAEPVAPPPPPAPVVEAPPRPAGPVTLGAERSVSCPERSAPAYPPLSRRLNEEGKVVLRVELDEHGNIGAARVAASSGFARLDEAALAAVKTWRCTPARRDGQPVRAVATQPFKFELR